MLLVRFPGPIGSCIGPRLPRECREIPSDGTVMRRRRKILALDPALDSAVLRNTLDAYTCNRRVEPTFAELDQPTWMRNTREFPACCSRQPICRLDRFRQDDAPRLSSRRTSHYSLWRFGTMKSRLKQVLFVGVVSICVLLLSRASDAAIIYEQDATYPGLFNAWTSSYATGTAINSAWSTFDDFELSSAANIQKIIWQGFYLGNSSNLPNTDQWKVEIYGSTTDNGVFVPNLTDLKASQSVAGSTVPRAAQGFGTLSDGTQVLVYNFEFIYTDFFPGALANTRYWLLIESASSTNDPVWAWMSGQSGNGTSIQQLGSNTGFFQRSLDRTFELHNDIDLTQPPLQSYEDPDPVGNLDLGGGGFASVPEPSSWIMFMALAAVMLVTLRVRSRRIRCVAC